MPRVAHIAVLIVLTASLAACRPDQPVSSRDSSGPEAPRTRAVVSGTVRDRAGAPVVGVPVQPRSLDQPSNPVPEILVTTDGQGRYEWTLTPGRYAIEVKQGDRTVSGRQVSIGPGETVTVDFSLG